MNLGDSYVVEYCGDGQHALKKIDIENLITDMKDADDINDIDDWIDAIDDEDFGTIGTAFNTLKFLIIIFVVLYPIPKSSYMSIFRIISSSKVFLSESQNLRLSSLF